MILQLENGKLGFIVSLLRTIETSSVFSQITIKDFYLCPEDFFVAPIFCNPDNKKIDS